MKRAQPPGQDSPPGESSFANSPSPALSNGDKVKRRRNSPSDCCSTCRLRKVKCGGKTGHGPCSNCLRLKLACGFDRGADDSERSSKVARTTPNGIVTEAGTLRKRAQRACSSCHLHKTKCSGDLPACTRCVANGLTCEYMPAKRKFANVPKPIAGVDVKTPASVTNSAREGSVHEASSDYNTPAAIEVLLDPAPGPQTQLLRREVVLKHVNAYFDHFFHMPCMGFLHPRTLYSLIDEDNLSPHLAAGICALTASVVSAGAAGRLFAARCNEQVEFHLLRNFGQLRADSLIFHVLVTVYNWMSGPLSKVWMWSSTAARLIKCLHLNYDPDFKSPRTTHFQREIHRRGVWQIYIIDHFLSGGYEEHLLLPSSSMHLRLPASDETFKAASSSTMDTLEGNSSLQSNQSDYNIHAAYVRLLTIRSQILSMQKRFTSKYARNPQSNAQFMAVVSQFQRSLNDFTSSLPELMKLSEHNVQAHLHRPDRPAYITLHTWVGITHIELYRFALSSIKDPATPNHFPEVPKEFLVSSRQQAVAHAVSLAQLWTYHVDLIRKHSVPDRGLITIDWMIGAWFVEVATILLTARKYALWHNLRECSSAQLCRDQAINDELLASLLTNIVGILELIQPYVPRVECYFQYLTSKVKQYDEEKAATNARTSFSPEHRNSLSNSHLPGPRSIIADAYLQPRTSTTRPNLYSTYGPDIHVKRASFFAQENPDTRRDSDVPEPLVLPFGLQRGRSQPSYSPGPSTPGQSQLGEEFARNSAQSTNLDPMLQMRYIPDSASPGPNVATSSSLSSPGSFSNFAEKREDQGPKPITKSQNDSKVFDPYALPFTFENEESLGLWTQHGHQQRGFS